MTFLNDPFLWALISMFGLVGACSLVGTKRVGRNLLLWVLLVGLLFLGRFLLVLPFCEQPRFGGGGWLDPVGWGVFVIGWYLGLAPSFVIRAVSVAEEGMVLQTTGFYGMVRNPIYLGELLWCLGWAIIHRSVIGVALVPLWWAGFLILIIIEEECLERALGQTYLQYKARVRGRIIPGLPV